MKKIIKFTVFYLMINTFSICVTAQSVINRDTSKGNAHLLWYTGKKKNDTTLVTNNGTTVTYSPKGNKVNVNIPSKQDEFKSLEDELDKTSQREQEAKKIILADKRDAVLNYPIYAAVEKAYEDVKQNYKQLTAKSIDLPPSSSPDQKSGGGQTIAQIMLNNCPAAKKSYDDILEFVKQHKGEKTFDLPPPPSMDYEHCWACDTEKQNAYRKEVDKYDSSLFAEESKRIRNAYSILRDMSFLGINEGVVSDPEVISALGSERHPTACTWLGEASVTLRDAILFLLIRANTKAQSLFEKYKGDGHYLFAVTKIYLEITRNITLAGFISSDEDVVKKIGNATYDFFIKYRNRIFIQHDWSQLPNIDFLIELARNCGLLGYAKSPDIDNFVEDYLKYNRFKLSFDVDCKWGDQGTYQLAHLKGDNYIRLVPDDSPACIRWVLIESDDQKKNLKMKLEAADMIAPAGPRPVYVGTHSWKTMMPAFHFHFCEDAKDTIHVNTFFPEGFKELWKWPNMGIQPTGIISALLLMCFIDENKAGEGIDKVDNQKLEEASQKKLDALNVKMEANKAKLEKLFTKGEGKNLSKDELATISKLFAEGSDIQESIQDAIPHAPGTYFFEVSHHNGSEMMVDEIIDGKKLFPSNKGIVYARFKIQIKQEPK